MLKLTCPSLWRRQAATWMILGLILSGCYAGWASQPVTAESTVRIYADRTSLLDDGQVEYLGNVVLQRENRRDANAAKIAFKSDRAHAAGAGADMVLDGNVRLEFSHYVLTTDPVNALQSVQTGEVTSRGIELEAVANVTPELKVVGAFTNFHIFVSKDLNSALIDKVPTNTPSEIASLWGDYTFKTGPLTGFGFGAGVRYNGVSYADQANSLVVPYYILGDIALHYEVKNWRFALNVINVTDHIYVGSCQTPTACFYGDRRRVTGRAVGHRSDHANSTSGARSTSPFAFCSK